MIRSAAAVVLALTLMLNPALVRAQDTVLTVTVLSADVHNGRAPSLPSSPMYRAARFCPSRAISEAGSELPGPARLTAPVMCT